MNLFNGDEDLQRRYADALKTSVDKTFGVEMNNERSLVREITEGFEALKSMRNNEPVAWRNLCVSNIGEDSEWIYNEIGQGEPLYTHPVKKLTDEEIYDFTHRMIICSGQNPNAADINIFGLVRIVEDILRKAQEK